MEAETLAGGVQELAVCSVGCFFDFELPALGKTYNLQCQRARSSF